METYSILRREEDEMLSRISLSGRVLDLGGHQDSSYFNKLKSEKPVEIANFDEYHPGTHKSPSGAHHIFDFEKPFPLPDASFNAVLCINVLEHIFNYNAVMQEVYRILKPGGYFYASVPFFFNIHGSPNDYFRYTRSALKRILEQSGFTDISVTELGYGPCTAVFQAFGGSIPFPFLRLLFMRLSVATDTFFSGLSKRYAGIRVRVPLGYFIAVRKPQL